MAEENKKQEKTEEKVAEAEKEISKETAKIEEKVEEHKLTEKKAGEPEKKPAKKGGKPADKKSKKTKAVVNGKDLPISTKHAVAICNLIRGKRIEEAVFMLQEVTKIKRAVPMKGELPHRKGKIMSGRYPIKASQHFIKLLKQLSANAIVNEIDLEKVKIECKANKAARPYRRFGDKRFKRSHVFLKLEIKKEGKKKK